MKTIIAGSRTIEDMDALRRAIILSGLPITEVISGGARGVDALGEAWAKEQGLPLVVIRADWKRHGKAAGLLRNQQMVDRAEALIAVWDGQSHGTADGIARARKKGIPCCVVLVEDGREPFLIP